MTLIVDPKHCNKYLESKLCRYYAKRLEKQEQSLSQSWFFCVVGFLIARWEKKLKTMTLTEAPFMVKSDFWNHKYAEYAEYSEYAEYAKYAKYAEYAEYIEYAEYS